MFEEVNSPTTLYSYESMALPALKRFKESTDQLEVRPEETERRDLPDSAEPNRAIAFHESHMKENEVISKYWANELKYLDPDQKLFAQKAINDVLFEARMKTLNRYSVEINRNNTS